MAVSNIAVMIHNTLYTAVTTHTCILMYMMCALRVRVLIPTIKYFVLILKLSRKARRDVPAIPALSMQHVAELGLDAL